MIGLKISRPNTRPIRRKAITNRDFVTWRVFPRSAPLTCICFSLSLVHCLLSHWNCFGFSFTTLTWKLFYRPVDQLFLSETQPQRTERKSFYYLASKRLIDNRLIVKVSSRDLTEVSWIRWSGDYYDFLNTNEGNVPLLTRLLIDISSCVLIKFYYST